MQEQEILLFALDIGTRSVVGVVGKLVEDIFVAIDYEQRFHRHGAMRDGQIEEINLVARTVEEVKEALEERNGVKLDRTAIAAAGRSLVTVAASYEQELSDSPITQNLIRSAEYGALDAAVESRSDILSQGFSCVGYSVSAYWLDDYRYSNLEGHQGKHLKVDVVAAFLPFSVIRSLFAVTERCGLSVDSLTLEPIAAISAVVPPDIRLLNIAIVDIGAGTSDVAISKNGSIIAYDMSVTAGDELTECLMRQFLTDFDTAEQIKKSIFTLYEDGDTDQTISYTNILGISASCSLKEVLQTAEPVVQQLCRSVAESILRINETPPMAVFLVGGGSQFPTLRERIAEELNLPLDRVAIGGRQPYKYIQVCSESLLTPEFVTPLGIGVSYQAACGNDFFSIWINDKKVMFAETENTKVLDALLLAGIKATELLGRTPSPLFFRLNGEKRSKRGIPAAAGQLFVNDEAATLDTPVRHGDRITVHFAKNGEPPCVLIADLLKEFDGPCKVTVNGNEASPETAVQNDDLVEITPMPTEDDKPARYYSICINGNWESIPENASSQPPQFVDVLNYVDIDPKNPQGDLILSLNGKSASYTDFLKDGDVVEIGWSK